MSPEAKLVVDASVAIKWYVPEPHSSKAVPLLDGRAQLLAPDLLTAELGNILWKKTRAGEITKEDAAGIAEAFVSACPVTLWSSSLLLQGALNIATALQRPIYDALYLALAVAQNCSFFTADARLARAIANTKLRPFVRLLSAQGA